MGNPRFTTQECSDIQHHVRKTLHEQEGLTVIQAYDIAVRQLDEESGQGLIRIDVPDEFRAKGPGHYVNARNEVVPIPGAITGYVDGKPVIACPIPESQPVKARITPTTIEGVEAEDTHKVSPDDTQELLAPVIVVAGEDDDDVDDEVDEVEMVEAAADAAVAEDADEEVIEEEDDDEVNE